MGGFTGIEDIGWEKDARSAFDVGSAFNKGGLDKPMIHSTDIGAADSTPYQIGASTGNTPLGRSSFAMGDTSYGNTFNQGTIGDDGMYNFTPEQITAMNNSGNALIPDATKGSSFMGDTSGFDGLMQAGQLGLGLASYFENKDMNAKKMEAIDQQIAMNKWNAGNKANIQANFSGKADKKLEAI